jgi:hypothetical protein
MFTTCPLMRTSRTFRYFRPISVAAPGRGSMTSVAPLSTRSAVWAVPLTVARITNVPLSTTAGASVLVDVLALPAATDWMRVGSRPYGASLT